MDVQLQEIIDRIHEDGVKSAEERAGRILADAEKNAADRIAKAKKEADALISAAKIEADRAKASGEAALAQAGRDLILSVKNQVTELFQSLIAQEAGEVLTPDRMGTIIAQLVEKWADQGEVEVLVSEQNIKALETSLSAKLAAKLKSGAVIRPARTIAGGFRIGTGDGSVHYDFTDESVAEILSQFLNPKLAKIMQVSAKG